MKILYPLLSCSFLLSCDATTEQSALPLPAPIAVDDSFEDENNDGLENIDDTLRVLRKVEATIAFQKERFDQNPRLLTAASTLIGAYSAKARLIGSLDPYEEAISVAERAEEAVPGLGARDAYASLLQTLHRNEKAVALADASIANPFTTSDAKAGLLAIKASAFWQNGNQEESQLLYEEAIALHPRPNIHVPFAVMKFEQGEIALARSLMDEALAFPQSKRGLFYAWLLLQRGILDLEQGRYTEAADYFSKANRAMPGWYLVQEHQAEVMVKLGQKERAAALYEDIIERTQNPEFMDALAELYDLSAPEEALALRAAAKEAYEEMLVRFPEIAYVHAVDHFAHSDPARALILASESVELRPGGAQQNVLAERYLAVGDLVKAEAAWRLAEASGYRTHDFHRVGFEIFSEQGLEEQAEDQRVKALAINPHALD